MRKMKLHKIIGYMAGVILASTLLMGCGMFGFGGEPDTEESQNESTDEVTAGLFLIMEHDTIAERMLLYSYETGTEYYFQYNFSTKFLNKYGDHQAAVRFTPGKAVVLEERDEFGYLTTVQMSDEVWEQEKIKRFSIDEERGVFAIANTNYSIQNKVVVFSNEEQVALSYITSNDTLSVVGLGNKILSITITTGQGTLALTNTELFEGSLMNLSGDMFLEITEDMTIDIPEGAYTLTVANDGWGGSCEIVIERGETTTIDLDTLKGEGKKKGYITFDIDVEDVRVYIDYKLVDHTQPVEVTYGTHTLEIRADGYDAWQRYLVVHSERATLVVELSEEEDDSDSEATETESESEIETESVSGTEVESESEAET